MLRRIDDFLVILSWTLYRKVSLFHLTSSLPTRPFGSWGLQERFLLGKQQFPDSLRFLISLLPSAQRLEIAVDVGKTLVVFSSVEISLGAVDIRGVPCVGVMLDNQSVLADRLFIVYGIAIHIAEIEMGEKILRFHFEHSHRRLHHFLAQALLLCLAFFPAQVFLFIEFFNITDSLTHSMISTPELFLTSSLFCATT